MSEGQMKELRYEAEHMFYHGYESYLEYAFPEDEIRPIACKPLTRDRQNPNHVEINDVLGNYSLTMIDSLSTLAVLASSSISAGGKSNKALNYFQTGVAALVEQYGDGVDGANEHGLRGRGFDLDSKVQVFETVIRGVGGLLSAHLFAVGDLPINGYQPQKVHGGRDENSPRLEQIQWPNNFTYNGQLLRLAQDLGSRILPAFHTSTGLPYPRVNLRHGIPFYASSPLNYDAEHGQCQTTQKPIAELTETCSAGAGSLVLEFTTLSRLSGDTRFEQLAKRAFWAIWERRSSIGLIGSGIDAETGLWTSPYTGIGAGIDSFFEYAAKSYVLLSNLPSHSRSVLSTKNTSRISEDQTAESFLKVWQDSQASIRRHLYRGNMFIHPHYIQADLHTGAARAFWMDSLSAFYPGLLTLTGDLEEAIETHILLTALWTRYSALPERWSTSSGGVEGGLGWWGGRPEFIESTYHLYQATRDPWYLHVGEMTLRDIKRRCWAKCGWTGIQDVRSGERSDRMESFFLGETLKYLFLLFDPDHPLNKLDAPFVFSTEGHPLIIPSYTRAKMQRVSPTRSNTTISEQVQDSVNAVCPIPPAMVPFSISATASRKDLFHAANLARLHFMPTPDTLESPLVEYSRDHPSISISDVRSPSNYTYFPWTLPLDLVPNNGICSKITARSTFDITFPPTPNTSLGPGALQRVLNGILVNSIGGLRLGMIQDVPVESGSGLDGKTYRVHAINNILLGKDERVFLAKDTASNVINPLDPNFTRVRDSSMLDLVVDVVTVEGTEAKPKKANDLNHNKSSTSSFPDVVFAQALEDGSAAASSMMVALGSLLQQVTSLMREDPPKENPKPMRMYIPAVASTGVGAAPLPDVNDALGPDVSGLPQGTLLWDSIYVADENCNGKLSPTVPRNHQVIVIVRGGCPFTQKLQNIPTFVPTKSSLQLVIIVSHDEDEEAGLPPGYLIRPWLETAQITPSGLPRHHPIPMVMVGGGEETWEMFKSATSLGIKRRYSVQAQGIPISNVVIL
ncbi:alpha mannosidase-like protein [Lobaria immixta]|nr:alpha mannosidase-like protein [Lobaria immixta]